MIKGVTTSGFAYECDENCFNDMEFLDLLVEAEQNGSSADGLRAYSTMVVKLLGKDQRKALYDHLRDENGRVPIEKVRDAITEIMSSNGDGKN